MNWTKYGMTNEEWEAKKEDIRGILAAAALALDGPCPVTYKELCAKMKSPPPLGPDAYELRDMLDQIDRVEQELGRGMLTSLVHNRELNRPGVGFLTLARELGHSFSETEVGKLEFTLAQMRRVADEQRLLVRRTMA
jgi:hypothetical protein